MACTVRGENAELLADQIGDVLTGQDMHECFAALICATTFILDKSADKPAHYQQFVEALHKFTFGDQQ